ncbi:winged helix DNA-binding domain-containing protein [Emticicia sp. BO119]|uniref:winged helix DNA-binding domain-containing protein n=1 Tax=Emticicia sp. BO119 TaxID=2757768 RepID=UPI0015F11B05|nr:winged helix DNA-binding domain-containing protein [Emticicia sp. BO119]MBA4851182.1 winged helix DNA-binding domain-containing protein [Emticicia sp. BO119]
MTNNEIIAHRLYNQQITETKFTRPEEIVSWLVAVQAQEYAMSKWAIGLRLNKINETDVELAINEGKILRTHVMRPTWHFVSPADLRWLLTLTAPRVHAFNAYQYRKNGLDSTVFNKCNDIMVKKLEGGKSLTRAILNAAFQEAGIITDTVGLSCIMMQAELDGLICSGPRQGKQFTYALIDERVPPTRPLSQEEALSQLALRYFTSRGPATAQDFVWWSGLTMKEARVGIANLPPYFIHTKVDKYEYIYAPCSPKDLEYPTHSFLMPDYDEYGIAYKNREAVFLPEDKGNPNGSKSTFPFNRMIIVNGTIVGAWQRTITNKEVNVEIAPFYKFNEQENAIVEKSVNRFKTFFSENIYDAE